MPSSWLSDRGRGNYACIAVGEAGKIVCRDNRFKQIFDFTQAADFIGTDEGDGISALTGTSGTTDAMYVILGIVRNVEVEHLTYIADVDSTCKDVGCHQYVDLAISEVFERVFTLALRAVSVDGAGFEALVGKFLRTGIGTTFRAGEDQYSAYRLAL